MLPPCQYLQCTSQQLEATQTLESGSLLVGPRPDLEHAAPPRTVWTLSARFLRITHNWSHKYWQVMVQRWLRNWVTSGVLAKRLGQDEQLAVVRVRKATKLTTLNNAPFRTGLWIIRSRHPNGQCGLRDPKLSLKSPAVQALTFARVRQVGPVPTQPVFSQSCRTWT